MNIGLDMDDVLVDLSSTWVEWLNNKYHLTVDKNDIKCWSMSKYFPLTDAQIYEPLYTKSFWENVPPKSGSIEAFHELKALGHTVKVITASDYRTLVYKFNDCLFKWYDISQKDVIVTKNKDWINCDLLCDDYQENLRNFSGVRVLMSAPHNEEAPQHLYDYKIDSLDQLIPIVDSLQKQLS